MDRKLYTMTLANGTVLKDLELNGNNYVSKTEVTTKAFAGNILPVKISNGKTEEVLDNVELVRIANWEDAYWILLQEKEVPSARMKLRADVDYLSMMLDIEL